ncbi:MAG: sialidase family protein [Opitutaceae bacterium]
MKISPFTIITLLMALNLSATSSLQHVVVYQQEGRFAGWPANNGAWMFEGDELLVGFTEAPYRLNPGGHNIGDEADQRSWLARSTDGGNTWRAYDPEHYVGDFGDEPELQPVLEPIDFSAPQFAMRVVGIGYHGSKDPRGHFFISSDGGQDWKGPYGFGDLVHHPELEKYGMTELTPRTDYLVLDRDSALIMVSARIPGEFGTDRLFCLRTSDGGRSFAFSGWVVPPYDPVLSDPDARVPLTDDPALNPHPSKARAVMSQSFLLADGSMVTAMRRRYRDDERGINQNWVDAYRSTDGGHSWKFMAVVGDAGSGNGNPPALNATADGRLCAVFGERENGRILVTYSSDEGRTWTAPFVLRDDFWSEDMETNDLGYPRLFRRSDGKMVALYYFSTRKNPHGIFATIWDPTEH